MIIYTKLLAVWLESKFSVPSASFPGKEHVWQLSWLLLQGRNNTLNFWHGNLSCLVSYFLFLYSWFLMSTFLYD